MKTSKKYAGLFLLVLAGFAFGRWSAPSKVEIKKEVVQVDQKEKDTDQKLKTDTNRDKKMKKIITEETLPDGTKRVKTEIVEDTSTRRTTDKDKQTHEAETKVNVDKESKTVEYKKPSLHVGVMGGLSVHDLNLSTGLIYGGYLQKSIIGPVDAGVWGLMNGTCGLSLGLTF